MCNIIAKGNKWFLLIVNIRKIHNMQWKEIALISQIKLRNYINEYVYIIKLFDCQIENEL